MDYKHRHSHHAEVLQARAAGPATPKRHDPLTSFDLVRAGPTVPSTSPHNPRRPS